ncbi:hypothetical protein CL634_03165 [bacterium]|nr:hypothetical protein [bacterium]
MRTLSLTNTLFDNLFTNRDRALLNEDYSYWRRDTHVRNEEREDSYEYYVPLPGFRKEDIKASILDDEVFILAKRDESTASYSFILPDDIDISTISAKNKDGLLTIKINKSEKAKAMKVEIT